MIGENVDFTMQELEAAQRASGPEFENFIKILIEQKKLKDVLATDQGKVLIKDLVDMTQGLMSKMISGQLTEAELNGGTIVCPNCNAHWAVGLVRIFAKYEFAMELYKRWSSKVKSYDQRARRLKEKAHKQIAKEQLNA